MNRALGAVGPFSAALALASAVSAQTPRWSPLDPPIAPSARSTAAVAVDTVRDVVVLFGGADPGCLGDTWEWNGASWSRRQPLSSPSARTSAAMAFDASRQRVVLFGGTCSSLVPMSDTWEWDGVDWVQRLPANVPPARWNAVLVHDPVRGRTVMFGGTTFPPPPLDDTWEWDGTDWIRAQPAVAPPRAVGGVFDPLLGRVVVHSPDAGAKLDAWSWDGGAWHRTDATHSPPPFGGAGLAYDGARGETVLVTRVYDAETWAWNGADWRRLVGPGPFAPRSQHAMWFDPVRQRVTMFGGQGTVFFDDTWSLEPGDGSGAVVVFGAGCAGAAGSPRITALDQPTVGATLHLRIDALPPGATVAVGLIGLSNGVTAAGDPLPADLTRFGMPACYLHIRVDDQRPLAATAGTASWNLAIPAFPLLIDATFFAQAFAFDGNANSLGGIVSDAVAVTIGN